MQKLMKIEVSESDNTLLATDADGEEYPVSLEIMRGKQRQSGDDLESIVEEHLQHWLACRSGYKSRHQHDDWKTIYEAEQ